jgi:GNAT superfamily N-acetyltransferase
MAEKDTETLQMAEATMTSEDAYQLLSELHSTDSGGLFTRVTTATDAALGLSKATDSPMWNTALISNVVRVEQAETIFYSHDMLPSFYVVEGEQTKGIHDHLLRHGYDPAWTDAWMKLPDSPELQEILRAVPTTGYTTSALADNEIDACLDVLRLRGYKKEIGPEDPYGEISPQELTGLNIAIRHLVHTGRGQCMVTWKETESGAEPVATATVAFLGRIAYISNLATVPSERHKGYGRAALLGAIQAGYTQSHRMAAVQGADPIICLATEPGAKPQTMFRRIGFKDWFRAQGYTLSMRNLFLDLKSY